MKPEDMNHPNEYPLSDAGFKKLIADHQERPFYPNCYKCHHQSAIVGCEVREDGSCKGTEHFYEREPEQSKRRNKMKISEQEEKALYQWGVKFYEMGWDATFKNIDELGRFCKGIKVDAIKKYIEEQREED